MKVLKSNNSLNIGKGIFIIFIFFLLIVGFVSCSNQSDNLTSGENLTKTRNAGESNYESIAHLLTSTVDLYNETFEVDQVYLNIIDEVVTIDSEKLENELEFPFTSAQEQVIDEINEDLQILVDLITSAMDDGLTTREIEEISWLWLQIIYPDIDFETLENNGDRTPDCPCLNKRTTCNGLAYSFYVTGMLTCAPSSVICPLCAAACLVGNGIILYNSMNNCESSYHSCLNKNGGC